MSPTITVLHVEDDDDDADLLAFALAQVKDRAYEVYRVRSFAEFQQRPSSLRPQIVLLDLHLPDSQGLDTVRKAVEGIPGVPVLVLTGSADGSLGLRAIENGAQDFIPKTELLSSLLSRAIDFTIHRAQIASAAAQHALRDPLTGLGNRAALQQRLAAATGHAQRYGGGFALAFIDLDGFKAVNDTYGHAAGDRVLTEVAQRCLSVARTSDVPCRLGGDEFVILLDGLTTLDQADLASRRFADAIEMPIKIQGSRVVDVRVGASLGLALYPVDGETAEALMSAADQRMYAAKAQRKRGRRTGS